MLILPSYFFRSFTPATLNLTAWWRDYGGSAPWSGTASAGTSGSNSNASSGDNPTAGTALNGHGTAFFNGTSNALFPSGTVATYFGSLTFSGWILLNATSVTFGTLLEDSGNNDFILSFSGSQVTLQTTGSGSFIERAISSGAYKLVTFRQTSTDIQIGVNEVPGAAGGISTAANTTGFGATDGTLANGSNGVNTFFKGTIAEIGLSATALTDTDFTNVKTYINTRYGLTL